VTGLIELERTITNRTSARSSQIPSGLSLADRLIVRTEVQMELTNKSSLTLQRQFLVETLQRINFGRLDNLRFRNAQPTVDETSRIVREHKFAAENGPRPETLQADFVLKHQLVELFRYFDDCGDGLIESLEVKHGLPFRMIVVESAI
jgi:hypothetical protein